MNTHTRIFRALSLPNRRRGLGLGLAALTGLSMPACDAPEDGEFAELTEEDSDGSESEQCGNGARCIARYVAGDSTDFDRVWQLAFPGGVVEARLQADLARDQLVQR